MREPVLAADVYPQITQMAQIFETADCGYHYHLFIPQRDHGIDFHGAEGGQEAREQRDSDQHNVPL